MHLPHKFLLSLIAAPLLAYGQAAPSATPAGTPPPAPSAAAAPSASPATAKPVELYSLDYDETSNLFYTPGTKTPYTGPIYSKYSTGVRETDGALKKGLQDGWWIEYAENGQKLSEGFYIEGAEEGFWTYWHDNGQIASQGTCKKGAAVEKWTS